MSYLCENLSEVGDILQRFADYVGISDRLRSYLAPDITGKHTEFQVQVKRLCIDLMHSEVEQSNQNHDPEGGIGHM